jgi:hypothetical protein
VAQDQGASDAALTSPSYRLKRAAGRAPRASRSFSKTRLDCRADRLQVHLLAYQALAARP